MSGELKQTLTVAGIEYMARNWHAMQARITAESELKAHGAAWQDLEARAAGGADPVEVEAEAYRLIGDALTAQRSVTAWFTRTAPPSWTVEDGHVVVGPVRVPLKVDLLAAWMEGESDDGA